MAITTLGYALLGLLARESCSGYDLGRQLKAPIGFYWHARYSQIYPELAKLEAEELATFEVVEQHDLPAKKVYTITEKGREALKNWVTAATDLPPLRDELVLKTFSLWLADPQRAIALFRQQIELHTKQLEQYEEFKHNIEEYREDLSNGFSPLFATYATLQAGLSYEQMYIDWCNWTITQLERTSESPNKEYEPQATSFKICDKICEPTHQMTDES